MTAWPRSAWESPWLAGLDAPARAQLEAAGAVRSLGQGEALFRAGQPADAFFVVAEGLLELRGSRRGASGVVTVRRAIAGDAVGEDAIVRPGAPRIAEATCATDAVVVEVPLGVFRRAAARAGTARVEELEERLRRSAIRDALRVSSLGASLSDEGVQALAAAAVDRLLERGEVVVERGDPIERAIVIGEGMVQATREDGRSPALPEPGQNMGRGRAAVKAYLGRGDVIDPEPSPGGHAVTVTACGPAWVLAIDRMLVRRWSGPSRDVLTSLRRLPLVEDKAAATRHVTQDLWRFAVARSMLVIDDDACVRCGHCAASCASAHGDGVSRLLRRGEKAVVHDAVEGTQRALVLAGSCQHCRNPVCMRDCPTGAIGREPDGEVFIRVDLCVGCGACAKACPWGSVSMAPRPPSASDGALDLSPQVAVKCDACHGMSGGPACVSACPVDAIARIDPTAVIAEVRDRVAPQAKPGSLPKRRSSLGWAVAGALVAMALSRIPVRSAGAHFRTGLFAGALLAILGAYAFIKRARGVVSPMGSPPGRSRVRGHTILHVALGLVTVGLVVAHSGLKAPPNAAGALLLAFAAASGSGALAAVVYRFLPKALGRVERQSRLPEDLALRGRELDERVFGLLTGRSDAAKAVYGRMLAPYARAPLGGLGLALRRTSLGSEERRLFGKVESILGPARAAQMDGLTELVRWAVERRANGAQRILQSVLRGVLPLHVVAVAATVVLFAVHVWCVARGR
jgi:Fe-S-cluster-containing dehydrogenase component/CRP-like cAMP-binding protein